MKNKLKIKFTHYEKDNTNCINTNTWEYNFYELRKRKNILSNLSLEQKISINDESI